MWLGPKKQSRRIKELEDMVLQLNSIFQMFGGQFVGMAVEFFSSLLTFKTAAGFRSAICKC
jgi:hypothetical protein